MDLAWKSGKVHKQGKSSSSTNPSSLMFPHTPSQASKLHSKFPERFYDAPPESGGCGQVYEADKRWKLSRSKLKVAFLRFQIFEILNIEIVPRMMMSYISCVTPFAPVVVPRLKPSMWICQAMLHVLKVAF